MLFIGSNYGKSRHEGMETSQKSVERHECGGAGHGGTYKKKHGITAPVKDKENKSKKKI